MLSLKKNFLFIHIPKTGGNSIQNILSKYSETILSYPKNRERLDYFEVKNLSYPSLKKHSTLMDYRKVIDDQIFKKLYKFACVRNPWERMISLYFYKKNKRGIYDWSRNDFIDLVNNHGRSSFSYLTTKGGGKLSKILSENYRLKRILGVKPEVDSVIRFENLQSDFDQVCETIGIPKVILPHRNKSKHKNYTDYYDDDLIKLIEEKCRDDIDYFGYTFD